MTHWALHCIGIHSKNSDVWIVKGLYPGIEVDPVDSVLGADAVGVVLKSNGSTKVGQRVVISPSVNWDSNPRGPEGDFGILGLLPNPGNKCHHEEFNVC